MNKMLKSIAAIMLFLIVMSESSVAENVLKEGKKINIYSPDKSLALSLFKTFEGRLSYSVIFDGIQVIEPSPLGITVDNIDLRVGVKIISPPDKRVIKEEYAIIGNHTKAKNHANEAIIPMDTSGKRFKLFVRVYNDGIAIRYSIPEGTKRINGESTSWNISENISKIAWSEYQPSYEGLSYVSSLDKVAENTTVMPPVTVEGEGYYLSLTEADCQTFSDMAIIRNGNSFHATFPFAKDGWDIQRRPDNGSKVLDGTYLGENVSPWRVAMVTRNLTELVNSDLLMNLCPEPANEMEFSWVKPGRCLWQWWSIGAPKIEDQKEWYNAAAKLNWEYYLIDDGWRLWKQPGKNQWDLLAEVISYGKSVGVKSIVWVDSKEMRQGKERRIYLEKVKALGADGIKIDFIPKATSDIMQWYMGTIHDCAELKLLLNFHGSVKPTGLRRTYPNDITREAVRGNEWHMTRYNRVAPLEQDVCLPFTRFILGPADITPVMLDPRQLESSNFTWARQYAQAVVFLSPIAHFADHYEFYLESPLFDLLQDIPTVWDETIVLPCTSMGEVVAFARRKGKTWWLGVINGANETEIQIPLNFLKNTTQATLVYDKKGRIAEVDRREQIVSPKDVLTIKLIPGGGFFARF